MPEPATAPLVGRIDMLGPGGAWGRIYSDAAGGYYHFRREDWIGGGGPALGQTVRFIAVAGMRGQRARNVSP